MSFGIQRQTEIYRDGALGRKPAQPISLDALEQQAKQVLTQGAYDYVAGGAGSEETMRANRSAFHRWQIVPRFLRDVGQRDLSVAVLGHKLKSPLMLAPVGVQGILHEEAEVAVARAARSLEMPFVLSTVSSKTMEEVAEAMGDVPHWFQLYWPKSDELAASFLNRAAKAGYGAMVVTLDTYLLAWRPRDLDNAYLPFTSGDGLANYLSDPVFLKWLGGDPNANPQAAFEYFAKIFSDPSRTWDDLKRLCEESPLPVIVKGVLHPDDARKAIDHGVAGVIVSNHGGRQLDGSMGALDALPGVVDAVGDQTTVLFDSGIRHGADVIKAMALGARAVLVGRPYCYGLAVNGEAGVRDVMLNLLSDVDLTLALSGHRSFADLDRSILVEPK